jgi:hypothetical protein
MKRNFRLLSIIFFALFIFSVSAFAQKNKDVDEALDDKNKVSGLHLGSYVGFGYSNGWQLDFSPGIGYRPLKWLIVEGGITYAYTQQFLYTNSNDRQVASLIGPRIGIKGNFYRQFYGLAEFQYLSFKAKQKDGNGNVVYTFPSDFEKILYLGAGYSSSFGDGFGLYTDFIFDVLYDRVNSPRSTPYSIRVGAFYTF